MLSDNNSIWEGTTLPGVQLLARSKVEKHWVRMVSLCWVEGYKVSCCCAPPLIVESQASLPFFFNHLFVAYAIYRIYTCVQQEGMKKNRSRSLVYAQVVWINILSTWTYSISGLVVVVLKLSAFVKLH